MRRYLLVGLRSLILTIFVLISFDLLLLGKVLDLLGRNHRIVTGTDPVGARQVVNAATKTMGWVIGKIRGYIAEYVRRFHPIAWRKLRDYLHPRR